MIPYYITFFFSVVFCFLGEKSLRAGSANYDVGGTKYIQRKKRLVQRVKLCKITKLSVKKYYIYFAMSILSVTILAGLRDYSIGTDILSYGNSLFEHSRNFDSVFSFIKAFSHIEPLYLVVVYISSLIGETPHMLYFLTGILIYSFLLVGFIRFKEKMSLTLSWICFLCLLYGDTYNAMRQSIAIAVLVWTFYYVTEKRWIKFICGWLIAFFFHNTAIFFFIIFAIYWIVQVNNKIYIKILLMFGAMVSVIFYNQILQFLIGVDIFNPKMERYYISSSTGFSIPAILIRIPFLALIIIEKDRFCKGSNIHTRLLPLKNEAEGDFYIIMLLCEMFTVEMNAFLPSLYRIALYFVPFRCMAYARICAVQTRKNRILLVGILLLYLLVVFVYQNQIKGNNDIYPYVFCFLN